MKNHRITLNVETVGKVEFDVDEETFRRFLKFCNENHPEKEWITSN